MNIAADIKKRRMRLGISQQDLAEFSGVGISTVKDIERGKGNPSLQTVQKLLEVLGLEMTLRVRNTLLTED